MFRTSVLSAKTFWWTFALVVLLTAGGAFGLRALYRSAEQVLDADVRAEIEDELQRLEEVHADRGADRLRRAVAERIFLFRERAPFYLLADSTGLLSSAAAPPGIESLAPGWHVLALPGRPVLARLDVLPGGARLLVGRGRGDRAALDRIAGLTVAVAAGGTLLLGLAASWLIGRSVIGRLESINRLTGEIIAGRFDGRLPGRAQEDEFGRLAAHINAMLGCIERLVAAQRTVTAEIAHNMRTPLTRLRGRLEEAARLPGAPEAARAALEAGLAETDTIIANFNALLGIARLEAETGQADLAEAALTPLVQDVCDLYAPLAEDRGIALALDCDETVRAPADARLLSQAVANLLDNAVKYAPAGGHVRVSVRQGPEGAEIAVADDGPGIAAAARERVLMPFVRLDAAQGVPGSGLGLAVVAAILARHGGRLALADAAPGLVATLALPQPKRPVM
ncbi:HAMP domain-containing sensor histidine kinase [Oleispirillum naphthae]|uniref:sensor histidine kinase n=1 Tax=Oleispirillum naphthae TaxID=2838853 RepID=UPI0030825FA7